MEKTMTVSLTEEDLRLLLGALDRAPFQGLGTARLVWALAAKLGASLGPRGESAVRLAGAEPAPAEGAESGPRNGRIPAGE